MYVSEVGQSQSAWGSPATSGGSDLDKSSFMRLLVEQLQHQDPMEPMSNTEFVAQLAQFSSVEQLVSMNQGIELLQLQQMGMSNTQAAGLIGKQVEARSDKLQVKDSDVTVSGAVTLAGDAEAVTVNIRDASGSIIKKIDLGARPKGELEFEWDCLSDTGVRVAPGEYRIDVVATDTAGASVSWEAQTTGMVTGVSFEAGYPELMMGSIRVALGDVISVQEG